MASSAWSLNRRNGVIFFMSLPFDLRLCAPGCGGEVRGEVVEDLGVAGALLLFAHRHLDRQRELGPAEHVSEGHRHEAPVTELHDDPLRLGDLAVRAAEVEPLLAVVRRPHADAERATRAYVDLGVR